MKTVRRILITFTALVVVGAGGGILLVDSLAKQAVERGGTHALGVPTTLEKAGIGLFSGRFSLNGMTIANPPGCSSPAFLSLRQAELELPLSSLAGQRITIPSLELEGIVLTLERTASGTNYGKILDSLKRFDTGEEQAPASDVAGGKTFLLQKLVIRDVRATAELLPLGGDLTRLSLTIPEIVVEDLRSEMSLAEICALVVKTVVRAAVQEGAGVLPDDLLQDLRGTMDGLKYEAVARIGAHVGEAQGKLEEAARGLGGEAEQALEGAGAAVGKKLDAFLKDKSKDKH